jgi:hypothetical protein
MAFGVVRETYRFPVVQNHFLLTRKLVDDGPGNASLRTPFARARFLKMSLALLLDPARPL